MSSPHFHAGSAPDPPPPFQEGLILREPPLGVAVLFPGGGFTAFPEGAGQDDLQREAWLAAMLPRLRLPSACVSEPALLPAAWGRLGFKGGRVSHGPAA